jgi:Ni/Fe-hydrogenase subunit HybB-like protein
MTSPAYPIREKQEKQSTWQFIVQELKPRGKWLTPFNIISIPVILVGLALIVLRFTKGLSAVSNVSQDIPWGLWKGFNVVTGVAFAGGAYVLTFIVYILRVKKYQSIIRATVLNGFLAYIFYAGALILDLGKPWNIFNPLIGNSFGTSSVLFLVAWHFLLYIVAQFLEFSPAIAEWVNARKVHRILSGLTIGAVIFGITLSTLHQSGLGALFLMAKEKIHPLWYSEFIPLLFLVSSVFAGLSMVIFEGSISQRVFFNQISEENRQARNKMVLSLSKICAYTLFAYLFMQIIVLVHGQHLNLLNTPMGYWYLLEIIGFVVGPLVLFVIAYRNSSLLLTRIAALVTILGIILNRLNVSIIAFRWDAAMHYAPTWMEIVVSLTIIFIQIWIFRWVIQRMPVVRESPSWAKHE